MPKMIPKAYGTIYIRSDMYKYMAPSTCRYMKNISNGNLAVAPNRNLTISIIFE